MIYLALLLASAAPAKPPAKPKPPAKVRHFTPIVEYNPRESCRKHFAGIYLSLYENAIQLDRQSQFYLSEFKKLSGQEKSLVAKVQAASQNTAYDAVKMQKLQGLQYQLSQLQTQLKELHLKGEQAQTQQRTTAMKFTTFQKQLAPLFTATSYITEGVPENFNLQFTSTCPRFRAACPLPATDREHLQQLTKQYPSEHCEKYAKVVE